MKSRKTARAILLAPDDRLLLFEFHMKAGVFGREPRRFWATPGGEIEEDEDVRDALVREVREETGIENCSFGPELWFGSNTLTFNGVETRTLERFFLVRSPVAHLGTTAWTDLEKQVMKRHRWWSASELMQTAETVFPPRLGYLVDELLRQGTAEAREIPL